MAKIDFGTHIVLRCVDNNIYREKTANILHLTFIILRNMNAKNVKYFDGIAEQPIELRTAGEYVQTEATTKDQFFAVVDFLINNQTHVNVDEIFAELSKTMPSITKKTINDALDALAETGAIQVINVNPYDKRFDNNPVPHAHFICSKCGHMEDIELSFNIGHALALPAGAAVEDTQIMCMGLCCSCRTPKNVN